MTLCRCGHGRRWHRATRNAISKRLKRGDRTPARQACQFGRGWAGPAAERWPACGCRDWHPVAA